MRPVWILKSTRKIAPDSLLLRSLVIFTVLSCALICTTLAQNAGKSGGKELAYGQSWGKESQADLAAFSAWVNNSLKSGENRTSAEGVVLAKQRRAILSELIKSDPAQAIAVAVPGNIREQLPTDVVKQLETMVSGIGDFDVFGTIPRTAGPAVQSIQKFVQLNGHTYRAYVYGRRLGETTKHGIPMHGVVIDDAIALHENGLRTLADGETTDLAGPVVDLRTPAEKAAVALPPVRAEMGGTLYGFATPEQMQAAEVRIEAAEAGLGPNPSQTAVALLQGNPLIPTKPSPLNPPNPPSPWTTGTKNVLIIRVDFSDLSGIPEGDKTRRLTFRI